jgi:hypothetical protein
MDFKPAASPDIMDLRPTVSGQFFVGSSLEPMSREPDLSWELLLTIDCGFVMGMSWVSISAFFLVGLFFP